MNKTFRKYAAKGFTLIELLIVVIIIAILAAIAIPQFSSTSSDAQEAALDANLNTLRSAVELYRLQHGNKYPSAVASAGGADCTTVKGVGKINEDVSFKEALTKLSNVKGETCDANPSGGAYVYGPYLREVPAEPVTLSTAIKIDTTATNVVPAAATGGWQFNNVTGQLVMNSNVKARDQREYYKH
jgi:prepilin-type N-terminal cleavage/methylation domain-containing protein